MTTRTEKRLVQEIWDDECDKILKRLTQQYHWDASYYVAKAVAEYLPTEKFEKFKRACENKNTHIWYNVLGSFAQERIEELRIEVRKPTIKKWLARQTDGAAVQLPPNPSGHPSTLAR